MSEEARPPFVIFETRGVEDRTASIEAGHYVTKDVNYAIITPAGTKDRIEKIAEDWLKDLEEAVRQERFPQMWLGAYQQAYKAWKETRETPEFGTPLTNWPALSPSQLRSCQDANLRSIEDVAEATDEGLHRLGMGGRALKEKAQAWLDASKGTGKIASELDALRKELKALKTRDDDREELLKKLQTENETLKKAVEA